MLSHTDQNGDFSLNFDATENFRRLFKKMQVLKDTPLHCSMSRNARYKSREM